MLKHPRSLAAAQAILERVGVVDPAALGEESTDSDGHTSEDRLGCSLAAHRHWLRTVSASELRGWAEDWLPDT